jgi:ribonuclease P protein component
VQVDEKSLRNAARKGVTALHASDKPFALPRACRLLRQAEYDIVYKEGRRRTGREFAVFLRPNGLGFSRFGWSIRKALGNAVKRNRIRRRLREILRLHRQEIAPGWDIVIHPRSLATKGKLSSLTDDLLKLLPRTMAQSS